MVPKRKKIAMYAAMIIITAIVVFPFLWMVLLSFKSSSEIMSNPLAMPKAFNLDNFKHALETLNFPQLYANTFVVCIVSVVLELIITFCSSFVIARMEFKHPKAKSLLYGFLILGLSVSPFILLFPVYKINIFFGLRGKWALIFPYAASSISFNTLLLTAYLKQLPTEIDEAAVIDGCNIWQLMVKVILPMAKPVIATIVILQRKLYGRLWWNCSIQSYDYCSGTDLLWIIPEEHRRRYDGRRSKRLKRGEKNEQSIRII